MVLAEKTCLWRLMCTCPRKLLNKSGICFSFNNPVEVLVEGPTLRVCKAVIHSSVQPLPCASAEVPLCGHATLAAAAVLIGRDEGKRDISTRKGVHFKTASGMLSVEKSDHDAKPECGVSPHFTMRLPLAPPSTTLPPPFLQRPAQETNAGAEFAICSQPAAVQAFLQACVGEGFKDSIVDVVYNSTLKYLVLRLADGTTQQQLESITPDFVSMSSFAHKEHVTGVCVTCLGGSSGFDFLSRFFGPWMGIPEDPVTGSAHTLLGPYWAQQLKAQKQAASDSHVSPCLSARQCSKRGGKLTVCIGHDQASLGGSAMIVMEGQLNL
uniref:Phenazine biosynthesis-like domain-containing protein n=1 Tax=Dunaliella tertiolecta TaxID=3047 RepID=A0A7S3QZV0_DUNTE